MTSCFQTIPLSSTPKSLVWGRSSKSPYFHQDLRRFRDQRVILDQSSPRVVKFTETSVSSKPLTRNVTPKVRTSSHSTSNERQEWRIRYSPKRVRPNSGPPRGGVPGPTSRLEGRNTTPNVESLDFPSFGGTKTETRIQRPRRPIGNTSSENGTDLSPSSGTEGRCYPVISLYRQRVHLVSVN